MRRSEPWDQVWMRMAGIIASMRSKDPDVQVGAVVVSPDNRRATFGYNGFPCGIKDTPERWDNEIKKDLVIHAEDNALQNANTNVDGWTLYVTLLPCIRCANTVIHRGISRVVYRDDQKKDSKWNQKEQALQLFKEAGVKVEKLQPHSTSARESMRSRRKSWWSSFATTLSSLWRSGTR